MPEQILKQLKKSELGQKFAALIKQNGTANIFGCNLTSKLLLAENAARLKKNIVYVVPDESYVNEARQIWECFAGVEVPALRGREWNLYDIKASSREQELERLAILGDFIAGKISRLIATPAALRQTYAPSYLKRKLLEFHAGDQIDPQSLEKKLDAFGYERVPQVEAPGQFAHRGDIVDIYAANWRRDGKVNCYRVSFFDIEIDELKLLDPETQRSIAPIRELSLGAVREYAPTAEEFSADAAKIETYVKTEITEMRRKNVGASIIKKLQDLGNQDAERLTNNIHFPALDRWLPVIYPETLDFFSLVKEQNPYYFFDEFITVTRRLQAAEAGFNERLLNMTQRGDLFPAALNLEIPCSDIFQKIDKIKRKFALGQMPVLGNGFPEASKLDIICHDGKAYRGNETSLLADLKKMQTQNVLSFVACGTEKKLDYVKDFLERKALENGEEFCAADVLFPVNISKGFFLPEAGIFLVGTAELLGSGAKIAKTGKKSKRSAFFGELKKGAYVVHEEHGIGRYEGTETIDTTDGKRDYLKIVYLDGVLHMPLEQLDLLSVYIAAGDGQPKLSRMGGAEWNRQKERAKASIKKLATDILALYAKRRAIKGHAFAKDTVWQEEFERLFPYTETDDQIRAIADVKADMESLHIMDRLICGDVGFGKTEVAFRAIFKCVMDGKQAVMLAPTTILVKQHYEALKKRLEGFPVKLCQLSRFVPPKELKNNIAALESGEMDIVIGTHRLLSKDVKYKDLGLLVVDEEQRFGVDHKEMLKNLSPTVDVLSLSATPIPRTLHMSLSGIRDISLLEEGPDDRRPIQTMVTGYDENLVYDIIMKEKRRDGQTFYLHNKTKTLDATVKRLSDLMPQVRFVGAHGQMSEHELENKMTDFLEHEYDVLVCTTIIESGIDMPLVNSIIVEDADRLGLSQMYQIRGRVGRSDRQAYALITYNQEKALTEDAQKRLSAIRDFTELGAGFQIALRDLEVRGAGSVLGAEQSGHLENIGYDLYCKMLDESINELQSKENGKKQAETLVDLPVDASLPLTYVNEGAERLSCYRKIAGIKNLDDYYDVYDELSDRYGAMPRATEGLLHVSFLRAFGERCGFERIRIYNKDVVMKLKDNAASDIILISGLVAASTREEEIVFSAGKKPYVLVRNIAAKPEKTAERLCSLFLKVEEKIKDSESEKVHAQQKQKN